VTERILVIEDEVKITDFLRRGLSYEGYEVDIAHDGEAGLAKARDDPPDLVVLDIMLPGLDGLEVCRRLRTESDAHRQGRRARPGGWPEQRSR
jgi:two-component system response regulator MprA